MKLSFADVTGGVFLAQALSAHQHYIEQLEEFDAWLVKDDHSNKQILYKLISDTIERRKPGGIWEDEENLPSVEDMISWRTSDNWDKFEAILTAYRTRIENAAHELCNLLSSSEFLSEIAVLPWELYIAYADQLITRLADSGVGCAYLNRCMSGAIQGEVFFDPDKIITREGDFWSGTFPEFRKAERAYTSLVLKMLPILVARGKDSISIYFFKIAMKYYNLHGYYTSNPTYFDLWVIFKNIREWNQRNPQYLKTISVSAGHVLVLVEIMNLALVGMENLENPTMRNSFKFMQALANTRLALEAARQVMYKEFPRKLLKSEIIILSIISALYDVIYSARDGYAAWKQREYAVVLGNVLVGVSAITAATATSIAVFQMTSAASVAAFPGVILALTATAIAFLGTYLIVSMKPTEIEKWFKYNYFGCRWNWYDSDDNPEAITYKWKFEDGTVNIARQISEYFSLFNPLHVTMVSRQDTTFPERYHLEVKMIPALADFSSRILIREIDDEGNFVPGPFYLKHLDRDSTANYLPLPPHHENDRLYKWTKTFYNFSRDYEGTYFEVVLTMPDQNQDDLAQILQQHPNLIDYFPYVLRQRIKVTDTEPIVNVIGIILNKNAMILKVGQSEGLVTTLIPINATNRWVDFSSDNPSVAYVSAEGMVTGISPGRATVTATTEDGGKKATCAVTIEQQE